LARQVEKAAAMPCCPCLDAIRAQGPEKSPVACLSTGKIRGDLERNNVAHFSGVPFAAPPVGRRRWLKPVPPDPWPETLDCSAERPKGPQSRRAWPMQEYCSDMKDNGVSEDCLHLDIWAPASCVGKGRSFPQHTSPCPVLIWIYGGGLLGGSKDYNDNEGRAWAERGIIFVCANYRCGVLGFLNPRGGDPNCGVWDQVESLRWVQNEIGAFGGDPQNVTIMGQSAGADMVYFLVSSPMANKLFRRAIIMSPASFTTTLPQAQELAEEFAQVAGAASSNLSDLQALSAEHILETQCKGCFRVHPTTGPGWRVMMSMGGKLAPLPPPEPSPAGLFRFPLDNKPQGYFFPTIVIDGVLFPEPPLNALVNQVAAHLEIIVGTNREEDAATPTHLVGKPQVMPSFGMCLPAGEGKQEILQRLAWEIAGMPKVLSEPPETLLSTIRTLVSVYEIEQGKDVYRLGPQAHAASEEQWLLDTMISDFSFIAASVLISERLAMPGACRKVFRYQFNGYDDRGDAFHAAELPLLLGEDEQDMLKLPGALNVRRKWMESWENFVRRGDPNTADMAGAWRPYGDDDRPVLFWDGVRGWNADGGPTLASRVGLRATAQLWEKLWDVSPVIS